MKIAITAGLLVGGVWFGLVYTAAQSPPSKSVPKLEETNRVINSLDGPTLFNTYCAVCHGVSAKGDGPMAKMLTAKTPDLARIAERHDGKFSVLRWNALSRAKPRCPVTEPVRCPSGGPSSLKSPGTWTWAASASTTWRDILNRSKRSQT